MANVKNFGLIGVGSDLQLGKAGTRIINNAGTFNFKAANGTTDAALTSAGITSSAGNITATTGNLVATAGNLTLNDATLVRQGTGVLQFSGSAAFIAPIGNTASRPTSATGMIRVNNDTPTAATVEYYDGTAWQTLGSSGSVTALQTEVDNIETSLGGAINSSGVFVPAGFTGAVIGTVASFTEAIQNVADYAASKDTLDEIFPSITAGNVIYSNGSNLWAQAAPGATSGVQGYDAGLAALAAKTSTGIMVQTGADTYASRTLVAPTEGFTITDADGVAGNPTFTLANDLAALEGLTTTGYIVRTGDGTATTRSVTGTSGRVVVTNGDGVSSDTNIDLATLSDAGTGTFLKFTRDTYGRVSGTTAVVQGDITGLVDGVYVNTAGDTMTGNLAMGGNSITGLAEPVNAQDAATKNYVDSTAAGLTWKTAVLAATTANITLSGTQTIDGVALVAGNRVLVKNQTDQTENGIYVVAAGAWSRSTDADSGAELDSAAVFVQTGTANADTGWVQTTSNVTIGTSNIVWVQFSGSSTYVAGVGLTLTGNTFDVNLGAGIAQLPSDEVGIDLFDATTGALILTTDGTTRSSASAAQLYLLLDGAGALAQTASGLKINAASVTNAMLVNQGVTLNADSGSGSLNLGQTLLVQGDSVQGIATSVSGQTITVSAVDATTTQKGVASFNTASFTTTSGAVSLKTVDIAHGGTNITSIVQDEVFFGNTGATAFAQSTGLLFNGSGAADTLTIGGTSGISIQGDGTNATLSVLATNGDMVLLPNGTGSVIVGPTGAGLIQSDAGQALTVRGNTTLTLQSVAGSTSMVLASGTSYKVDVSGPTAADYATGLADTNLVNKYYVDQAIQTGAASGAIKAVKATVPLNADGTTNIGAALPAGATILSVKVNVTVVDTTATLSIGKTGSVSAYMTTAENDAQTQGLYLAETYVTEGTSVQVIATVASSTNAGSGSCQVIVEYQVA